MRQRRQSVQRVDVVGVAKSSAMASSIPTKPDTPSHSQGPSGKHQSQRKSWLVTPDELAPSLRDVQFYEILDDDGEAL